MHTSDIKTTPGQQSTPIPVDPAVEAAEQARAVRAAAVRRDAYARLKLGDQQCDALEWAYKRRSSGSLSDLKAFFDESAAQETESQALAWMNGPLFRGDGLQTLNNGISVAVRQHSKWLRADRFAELAEKTVSWSLNVAMAAFVVVCAVYAIVH